MDVTKKRQPLYGLNTFFKNSVNLLVSNKNVDIHMVKEYFLNTKIGRFEMFIIPFRFLLGKTSVMDVT